MSQLKPLTNSHETLQINDRGNHQRQETGLPHENKPPSGLEDDSGNSMSGSEEHEMDEIASDAGSDVDEETGLTGKEGQKHGQRQREQNTLDARVGGGSKTVKADSNAADKAVLRTLLVNAVLIGLWYMFSLAISIYNKWMFSSDHLDFHFPLFTTSIHMLVQTFLAALVLLLIPSLRPKQPQNTSMDQPLTKLKPLITPLFYATRLIPCGATTSLDIGLGNTSLRYITLTFYTMCKSSVLGFVLLFAFLFRLESPNLKLILIIVTMTAGVLLMVAGETTFNALGFALAISASFFSGFRWALTQILLLRHPATSNPFATMFWLAPIMFVTLFLIALVTETPSAVLEGIHTLAAARGGFKSAVLLLFPGTLAFCMTSAEFALLQRTNVVTLSICGIFKEVVTISAAGAVFGDELTPINITGLVVTLTSIAAYNYLKVSKMRRDAQEKALKEQEEEGLKDGTAVGSLRHEDFDLDVSDDDDDNEHDDRRRENMHRDGREGEQDSLIFQSTAGLEPGIGVIDEDADGAGSRRD